MINNNNANMDITTEIKEKVFAQYLGNRWKFKNDAEGFEKSIKHKLYLTDINHVLFDPKFKECGGILLILKPISDITDEDAIEVAKLIASYSSTYLYYEKAEWEVKNSVVGKQVHVYWKDTEIVINHGGDGLYMRSNGNARRYIPELLGYQYLQSKGYDLPQYLLGGKTMNESGLAIYE